MVYTLVRKTAAQIKLKKPDFWSTKAQNLLAALDGMSTLELSARLAGLQCELGPSASRHIVALKSMYPLLSLLCTKISSCGCAER